MSSKFVLGGKEDLGLSFFNKDVVSHTMILGTTGEGKSFLMNDEYPQFTEEQKEEIMKKRKQEIFDAKEKEDKRFALLKDAYWKSFDEDAIKYELSIFQTMASMALDLDFDEVTIEQIKTVFMLCPNNVFADGLKYGFSDTEVGEYLNEFYEDELENIKSALKKLS